MLNGEHWSAIDDWITRAWRERFNRRNGARVNFVADSSPENRAALDTAKAALDEVDEMIAARKAEIRRAEA